MGDIVYLDICCFKRPFDDAAVERAREAGRVAAILEAVQRGSLRLVRSPAHDFENERNPREDRRLATWLWLDAADAVLKQTPSSRCVRKSWRREGSGRSTRCIWHAPNEWRPAGS